MLTDLSLNEQWSDESGNPAGGVSQGVGFTISWQNGPLAVDGVRKEPSGAFVETVLKAVAERIEFYQRSKFNSSYNADALEHIYEALAILNARTTDRETRQVEGTHAV